MNWMYALYATYEQNRDYVGRIDKEPAHGNRKERLITPLLPLYHSMQNAHITITLNKQGELINASLNNQNSQPTIIPVTEASGGRTSGACAHPLCDKLQYVAGDNADYFPDVYKRQPVYNRLAAYLGEAPIKDRTWSEMDKAIHNLRDAMQRYETSPDYLAEIVRDQLHLPCAGRDVYQALRKWAAVEHVQHLMFTVINRGRAESRKMTSETGQETYEPHALPGTLPPGGLANYVGAVQMCIRDSISHLPGATGHDRTPPETLHGLVRAEEQLIKAMDKLPADKAGQLKHYMLTMDELSRELTKIVSDINTRTDHRLEGWERCGFMVEEQMCIRDRSVAIRW